MSSDLIFGHCHSRFQPIADRFAKSITSGYEVGATLAVEYQGEMMINLWGGHQNAAKTRIWQEDTLVNTFSVTKGVVAACVARLIEQNRLDIHQRVAYYWPDYGCHGKEQTRVLDLLCHRAGMFGFREPVALDQWADGSYVSDRLARQRPFRTPGSGQSYHALTFGWLVGELIRRVDGRSVGVYFREEIAQPLALDFHIGLAKADLARCADQLMSKNQKLLEYLPWLKKVPDTLLPKQGRVIKAAVKAGDYKVAFQQIADDDATFNADSWRRAEIPAANGHGTAASLAKLYGVLSHTGSRNNYHLLSPQTVTQATQIYSNGPDVALFGLPFKFGLGYMVDSPSTPISSVKKRFGHSGIGGGMAFGDRKHGLGFAFLNNQQHGAMTLFKTANQLAKTLYTLL